MKKIRSIPLVDILLFFVVIIWASNFTIIKIALRDFPPMAFNVLRFIASSIVFSIYYHFFIRDYSFIKEYFWRLILLALIGNTIMQITFIYGMDNTTAGNASLMYSTVPIFIALLSVQLKMEKVTSSTWLGIFISFVGIALILTKKENGFTFSTDTFTGDILILATSFSWSAYTVLAKPLIEKTSMLKVVSITFIFGTLFLIPFGIPDFITMDWSSVSYGAWSALFYSFLFANVIAYLIWFYSVTKVGNVQTAIFQNMVPVFAVIIAVIFLNEKFTWIQAIGGAGIIGGVTITRLTMNNRKNIKH